MEPYNLRTWRLLICKAIGGCYAWRETCPSVLATISSHQSIRTFRLKRCKAQLYLYILLDSLRPFMLSCNSCPMDMPNTVAKIPAGWDVLSMPIIMLHSLQLPCWYLVSGKRTLQTALSFLDSHSSYTAHLTNLAVIQEDCLQWWLSVFIPSRHHPPCRAWTLQHCWYAYTSTHLPRCPSF